MDLAIRHIGFRNEAKSLKGKFTFSIPLQIYIMKTHFSSTPLVVALKRSQHHADEFGAKLEAAGKALEEASARATAAEEKLAEEKSKMATREADIRLRLDTLNASFISK